MHGILLVLKTAQTGQILNVRLSCDFSHSIYEKTLRSFAPLRPEHMEYIQEMLNETCKASTTR